MRTRPIGRPWRTQLLMAMALTLAAIFSNCAGAADFPARPIQIVVPFAAGGGGDILSRLVAERMTKLIGSAVIVVNRPGAAGIVGTNAVLAAPPDGYSILFTVRTQAMAPYLTKAATFDFLRDFTMINLSTVVPAVLIVKKDAPWSSLGALVADAKNNPGRITYASSGPGSTQHLAGELIKTVTRTDITHVPFGGAGASVTAVLGGHVSMSIIELTAVQKMLQDGSLRALAVMDRRPLKDFPGVPTSIGEGFPQLNVPIWQGFSVRAGTPRPELDKLSRAFRDALAERDVAEKLERLGSIVENLGPEKAAEFVMSDTKVMQAVVAEAKIEKQ